MQEFQCLLVVLKLSYICCYIIYMTVPLSVIFVWLKQIRFCCFRECRFDRDQISQFENETFWKKKNSMKVLGLCLPYVKRYFQEDQLSVFFFMAEITKVLLFSVMPISQRSKITVWERHLLKKNLLWMFLVCVYLTWKGMFISTSKVLFSLWLK